MNNIRDNCRPTVRGLSFPGAAGLTMIEVSGSLSYIVCMRLCCQDINSCSFSVISKDVSSVCRQVAEEDCGSALANDMAVEPYFVDFLRDAPDPTGL